MPDIVTRIDPVTIAEVIEANINAYLLSFARLPGAILHDGPESIWVDSGVASSAFNSVVSARLTPETADAEIDAIVAHFRRRALPVTWHVGPTAQPAELGRLLVAHGFTLSEDEPGMAVEIDQVHDDATPPPSLMVEQARDEGGLAEWVSAWLFPAPDEVRRLCYEALRLRGLGDALPWQYFVGYLDGTPVATSELFVAEGVAAVHYVTTLPEVRRRGIGTAMTLRVLREARARGYRVAVLTASPDGIGCYRRLGFREYCWFHRYDWGPDNDS